MRRSCSRTAASIISSTLFLLDPLALQRIACLLPIRQAACVMHDMGIAVTLQELAEGFTRDAAFVGTVHDDLVLSVERLQRLPRGGEVDGTGNMLRLVRPLCQRHHQAEVFLAVQFLLQLFAIERFHPTPLWISGHASYGRFRPGRFEPKRRLCNLLIEHCSRGGRMQVDIFLVPLSLTCKVLLCQCLSNRVCISCVICISCIAVLPAASKGDSHSRTGLLNMR